MLVERFTVISINFSFGITFLDRINFYGDKIFRILPHEKVFPVNKSTS